METPSNPKTEDYTYKQGQYSPRKRKDTTPKVNPQLAVELVFQELKRVEAYTKRIEDATAKKVEIDPTAYSPAIKSLPGAFEVIVTRSLPFENRTRSVPFVFCQCTNAFSWKRRDEFFTREYFAKFFHNRWNITRLANHFDVWSSIHREVGWDASFFSNRANRLLGDNTLRFEITEWRVT